MRVAGRPTFAPAHSSGAQGHVENRAALLRVGHEKTVASGPDPAARGPGAPERAGAHDYAGGFQTRYTSVLSLKQVQYICAPGP